jgi:hypothetical protein
MDRILIGLDTGFPVGYSVRPDTGYPAGCLLKNEINKENGFHENFVF